MEGTWPLRLDGVECGSVTARRSGAYTLFSARALYMGPLKRISLYGPGGEAPLGVLAPDGDGCALERRLTRRELAALGGAIDYAAESGGVRRPDPEPENDAGDAEPEAAPEEGELWYSSPDGSLSRFDGERLLVALPADRPRVPDWAKGVLRRISGREYVVFPR